MELFILDTETQKRYALQYLEPNLVIGSSQAQYQPSGVPMAVNPQRYWLGTDAPIQSLTAWFDGINLDAQKKAEELRSLTLPAKNKMSPPIVFIQVGQMLPIYAHITAVTPEYDMSVKNIGTKSLKPDRVRVSIQYLEVDKNTRNILAVVRDAVATRVSDIIAGR